MASYDEIKLDYDLAAAMSQEFKAGAEQLQDTMQEMQNLANILEEGALLGRAGETFVDAVRGNLSPSIARLTEKYRELDRDVQDAIRIMRGVEDETAGLFGGR